MHASCPLDKAEWGPAVWKVMHTLAAAYPTEPTPEHMQAFYTLMWSLPPLLPCPDCGKHMRRMLESGVAGVQPLRSAMDPRLRSRQAALEYTVDMHNAVNRRVGNPCMPYERIRDFYDQSACDARRQAGHRWLWALQVLFVCVIVLTLVAVYMRWRRPSGRQAPTTRAEPTAMSTGRTVGVEW